MASNTPTILQALEIIHKTSKDTKLEPSAYQKIKPEILLVSKYFQTTEIQSILLASFVGLSCLEETELSKITSYFGLEKMGFFPFIHHLKTLENKNLINKESGRNFSRESYILKSELIPYIAQNKPIPNELICLQRKEDTFHEFLGEIDRLSNKKSNNEIDYRFFAYQFKNILARHKKFKLVEYALRNLQPIDSFVFFDVIIDGIAAGENNFQSYLQSTVDDFTDRQRESFNYISDFLQGKTKLNKLNLIEKDRSIFSNKHKIQLTEKAVSMLLELEGIKFGYHSSKSERLIYPDNIQKIPLYYNDSEDQQLNPLIKSMTHRAFVVLQKRLREKNMPTGLTSLLYGAPGTGKTETVYQLAKKYNRAIFKVEISQTKSMWFGESQKLVKKIFTDYNEFKNQEKICPILLFNEADAIIGKRKNAGSSSVADTENAIQNILLEELENFSGILFATSNLVNNIDSAFERRFLFKLKFDVPSHQNAAKIWRNKLPSLSVKEAEILSAKFNYSGGEMQNIARKCIVEEVIAGNKTSFEQILSFCQNEKWNKSDSGKMGYVNH